MKNVPGFTAARVEASAGFNSASSNKGPEIDAGRLAPRATLDQVTPHFSVVICAYSFDRWDELLLAVQSLQMQSFRPLEVIVVIDHNTELFLRAGQVLEGQTDAQVLEGQVLERQTDVRVLEGQTDVRVLENRFERGLSGARNSGLREAHGDLIAFLDDDAMAAPDWLERLAGAYADPNTLGVGGAIVPNWCGPQPAWFPPEFYWVIGCTYLGLPERTGPVRNMIGANMSFRRSAFEGLEFRSGLGRIGTVPLGGEETDLCIRAVRKHPNGVILYEPSASVQHLVTPERAQVRYFLRRCYAEGISKAAISRFVGSQAGLSSERSYVAKVLPRGVLRGLGETLRGHGWGGAARAISIVAGLGATAVGYAVGLFKTRNAPTVLEVA
jgi:glycosyltransferase involved in cell wall biosynthesis